MNDTNIIPFGKYKGRLVEELLADDPSYLQWLSTQDWFRAKYVTLHQVIINRGAEPEETPEHNALQVLFLEDDFCIRLVRWLYDITPERLEKWRQHGVADCRQFKSYHGTEERLAALSAPGDFVVRISERQFEARAIDVFLRAVAEYNGAGVWERRVAVEIKPTVGDDYPAVLRQMHRMPRFADYAVDKLLLLGRYTGEGATPEQFAATFRTAGITVLLREEMDEAKRESVTE